MDYFLDTLINFSNGILELFLLVAQILHLPKAFLLLSWSLILGLVLISIIYHIYSCSII